MSIEKHPTIRNTFNVIYDGKTIDTITIPTPEITSDPPSPKTPTKYIFTVEDYDHEKNQYTQDVFATVDIPDVKTDPGVVKGLKDANTQIDKVKDGITSSSIIIPTPSTTSITIGVYITAIVIIFIMIAIMIAVPIIIYILIRLF